MPAPPSPRACHRRQTSLLYDTGLKVPAPPPSATPRAAQLFKGTTRNTYALQPEVSGRPTRPSRSGLHPALPPGHTPIWANPYRPLYLAERSVASSCAPLALSIVNHSHLGALYLLQGACRSHGTGTLHYPRAHNPIWSLAGRCSDINRFLCPVRFADSCFRSLSVASTDPEGPPVGPLTQGFDIVGPSTRCS